MVSKTDSALVGKTCFISVSLLAGAFSRLKGRYDSGRRVF